MLKGKRKYFVAVWHVCSWLHHREQALLVVDFHNEALEKVVGEYSVGFAALKCEVRPVVEGDDFVIDEIKTRQSKLDILEKFHLDVVAPHALRRTASFRFEAKLLSESFIQRGGVCACVQDEPERT